VSNGRNLTLPKTIPGDLSALCEPGEEPLDKHESDRGPKEDDDAAENSREATGNIEEESPQYETEHEEFAFVRGE